MQFPPWKARTRCIHSKHAHMRGHTHLHTRMPRPAHVATLMFCTSVCKLPRKSSEKDFIYRENHNTRLELVRTKSTAATANTKMTFCRAAAKWRFEIPRMTSLVAAKNDSLLSPRKWYFAAENWRENSMTAAHCYVRCSVCMYECMYKCYTLLRPVWCMYVCMPARCSVRCDACTFMGTSLYLRMYVCIYECMCVYMNVCVCIYMYDWFPLLCAMYCM